MERHLRTPRNYLLKPGDTGRISDVLARAKVADGRQVTWGSDRDEHLVRISYRSRAGKKNDRLSRYDDWEILEWLVVCLCHERT